MQKAFYLKINRNEDFAYRNLKRWVDIALVCNADCYIICDKPEVEKRARETLVITEEIEFIKSIKSEVTRKIAYNVTDCEKWRNAAFAHLTTFVHAAENGYSEFWNIDADDTRFCLSVDRTAEALVAVEKYAIEQNIECISLDMWRSGSKGQDWSFGITYTDGNVNWIEVMLKYCLNKEFIDILKKRGGIIDHFFSCLKEKEILNIETFYFENLRFIHYSADFFYYPVISSLYFWKDGHLIYPILYYCFGDHSKGKLSIATDVIKFDIGIKDEEVESAYISFVNEDDYNGIKNLWEISYDNKKIKSKVLLERKKELFLKYNIKKILDGMKDVKNLKIVGWGSGDCFRRKFEKIQTIFDVKEVCDNDSAKWEMEIEKGVICISPCSLKTIENVFVFIMIDNEFAVSQVEQQLAEMGIMNFAHINHWIRYTE